MSSSEDDDGGEVELRRPWAKRAPTDGPWDVIVVGTGIGGMTAAGVLSETGQRVLLLEQHYVPGGYTHTFRRKGYSWSVGVHVVGEQSEHSLSGRLLNRLSRGRLRWKSVGPIYDTFHLQEDMVVGFPDNPAEFTDVLSNTFPDESRRLLHYLEDRNQSAHAMRGWFAAQPWPAHAAPYLEASLSRPAHKAISRLAWDAIEQHIRDPKLRALLAAQWGYYGSSPHQASFGMHALTTRHFQWGGYYPERGSGSIARGILQTVADNGGWTRICAPVQRFLVEGGRAVGVELEGGEQVRAKTVIAATNVHQALRRLPEEHQSQPWAQSILGLRNTPAFLTLYVGLKGDITQAGATAANRWFYQTLDFRRTTWNIGPEGPREPVPCVYTSFPSLKDPQHDPGPEQRHMAELITFVPWEVFRAWDGTKWRRRGADYDALKQQLTDGMLEVLYRHMPGLRGMIDHAELGTPLSADLFARPSAGSIYGLEHVPERFQNRNLRPRTPIPGLYLAGSDIACCGIVGAMVGGVLAAAAVSPLRVGWYLRSV